MSLKALKWLLTVVLAIALLGVGFCEGQKKKAIELHEEYGRVLRTRDSLHLAVMEERAKASDAALQTAIADALHSIDGTDATRFRDRVRVRVDTVTIKGHPTPVVPVKQYEELNAAYEDVRQKCSVVVTTCQQAQAAKDSVIGTLKVQLSEQYKRTAPPAVRPVGLGFTVGYGAVASNSRIVHGPGATLGLTVYPRWLNRRH